MRCFLALDLPEALRDEVSDLQMHLRVGRLVPEENLHLTLAFLDDQPEAILQDLNEALCEIEMPVFKVALQGLELFGGKKPRLLYLQADGGQPLRELHRVIRRAAQDVGIDLARERFRPHVTLARFGRYMREDEAAKLGHFLETHADVDFGSFEVAQFCLFGSTLHPDGAEHEVLAQYALG